MASSHSTQQTASLLRQLTCLNRRLAECTRALFQRTLTIWPSQLVHAEPSGTSHVTLAFFTHVGSMPWASTALPRTPTSQNLRKHRVKSESSELIRAGRPTPS